jgi:dCTP deaminase
MPHGVVSGKHLAHLLGKGLVTPVPRITENESWVIPLHLGEQFLEYYPIPDNAITLPSSLPTRLAPLDENGKLLLAPGACVLACTRERVDLPLEVMGWISTKGNVARSFLTAHVCDGQIDPGYYGTITLELVNHGPFTFALEPGMAIANLYLLALSSSIDVGYKGRFWGSVGPTPMIGPDSTAKEILPPSPHPAASVGMRRRVRIPSRDDHKKTFPHRGSTRKSPRSVRHPMIQILRISGLFLAAMILTWLSR